MKSVVEWHRVADSRPKCDHTEAGESLVRMVLVSNRARVVGNAVYHEGTDAFYDPEWGKYEEGALLYWAYYPEAPEA